MQLHLPQLDQYPKNLAPSCINIILNRIHNPNQVTNHEIAQMLQ